MGEYRIATREDMKTMAPLSEFDPGKAKNCVLDIQCGTLPEQQIDVFMPEHPTGKMPVLFYVHGGAWIGGTRRFGSLESLMPALDRGYAIIGVEYRLAPKTQYPEFLYDCKTAVRWARAHAEEYNFDTERFCVIGDSAGGYLALMLGVTGDMPKYEGAQYGWAEQSSAVQAVCCMYGISALELDEEQCYAENGVPWMRFRDEAGRSMFDLAFGTNDKAYLAANSPAHLVHENIPPMLIHHGTGDSVVPYKHSLIMAEEITKVCGKDRVTLKFYPCCNHGDVEFVTPEHTDEVLDFFDKALKR